MYEQWNLPLKTPNQFINLPMNLPFFPSEETITINPIFMPWSHHVVWESSNLLKMAPVNMEHNIQVNLLGQDPPQHLVEEEEEPIPQRTQPSVEF